MKQVSSISATTARPRTLQGRVWPEQGLQRLVVGGRQYSRLRSRRTVDPADQHGDRRRVDRRRRRHQHVDHGLRRHQRQRQPCANAAIRACIHQARFDRRRPIPTRSWATASTSRGNSSSARQSVRGVLPRRQLGVQPSRPRILGQIFNPATLGRQSRRAVHLHDDFWRRHHGMVQYVSIPASPDFDSDGDVDGADFLTWQRGFGGPGTLATGDADADGDVDGGGPTWRGDDVLASPRRRHRKAPFLNRRAPARADWRRLRFLASAHAAVDPCAVSRSVEPSSWLPCMTCVGMVAEKRGPDSGARGRSKLPHGRRRSRGRQRSHRGRRRYAGGDSRRCGRRR